MLVVVGWVVGEDRTGIRDGGKAFVSSSCSESGVFMETLTVLVLAVLEEEEGVGRRVAGAGFFDGEDETDRPRRCSSSASSSFVPAAALWMAKPS